MQVEDVPIALRERLGPNGSVALVELLNDTRQEWTVEITTTAVERFERRLSDELGTLREEMRSGDAALRVEVAAGFAAVRVEMGDLKFDLLKWSFAFWIGQVLALTAIIGAMLQALQT